MDSKEQECEPLPSVKLNHSAAPSSQSTGRTSPATTTCEPLPLNASPQMELLSTQSAEGSPAKTFQYPGKRRGSKPRGVVSGRRSLDLLATYDQSSSSWRTSQTCLVALLSNMGHGLGEFSQTWPRSGMMRNGIAYKRPPSALHMVGTEYGSLPTPTKSDATAHHSDLMRFDSLSVELRKIHGHPSRPMPSYLEWMMGFPTGWTDAQHSATQLFPKSPKSSGGR